MSDINVSKRNEKILWIGKWTSKIGDIIFDYVNSVLIVHAFTSNSWILATYQSSQTIINVFFNLLGGVLADMNVRKRILVITDFLSGLICLASSFFVESRSMVFVLLMANALLAFIFSFSSPTFKSIVKEMIDTERIHLFNSISNAGTEIITMMGPALGLFLMNYVGARGALITNAITFIVSGVLELFLSNIHEKSHDNFQSNNILRGIIEGFCYLWTNKRILLLVLLSAFVNFFLAGYNLMVPYSDVLYEKVFVHFYSKIMIVEAVGGIIGAFVNARLPLKITGKYLNMIFLLLVTGSSLLLPALISEKENVIICLVPFFIFGIFLTMYNINFMSYVQENVTEEYLGRVFSIIFTLAVIFMPFGSFCFSKLEIIRSVKGFSITGIGIVMVAVAAMFFKYSYRKIRKE